VRRLVGLGLALRHRVLGRRHRRLSLEKVDDVSLLVLPSVFNPVLFRTGALLARSLAELDRGTSADQGRALDLGTGSGIGAVFAARSGYRVIASDINPDAVRCARINALLNQVEDRIEVRDGDLFEPVEGELFDLVLFNPPFFRGAPRDRLDQAWRSPDVLGRFARELPAHLKPDGRALVVLSTDGEGDELLRELDRVGFTISLGARRDLGNEVVTVYELKITGVL